MQVMHDQPDDTTSSKETERAVDVIYLDFNKSPITLL